MYYNLEIISNGQVTDYAILDEDVAIGLDVAKYTWYSDKGYAKRLEVDTLNGTVKSIYLHHEVLHYLGIDKPSHTYAEEINSKTRKWVTDHIDGKILNNTRDNLWYIPHWLNTFKMKTDYKGYTPNG